MGQTQVEIVGEALGIPAYVLIADVGLPVSSRAEWIELERSKLQSH